MQQTCVPRRDMKTDGPTSASMWAGRRLSSAVSCVSKLLGLSQSAESEKGLITAFSSSRFTNRLHCPTEEGEGSRGRERWSQTEWKRRQRGAEEEMKCVGVWWTSSCTVCLLQRIMYVSSLWPGVGGSFCEGQAFPKRESVSLCVC